VIDPDLLAILACPVCEERPPLEVEGEFLVCTLRGHGFRVTDGIPNLLPESAIPPDEMRHMQNDRDPA
jgi:uncharacterized protein YbaR (Trm112 family)